MATYRLSRLIRSGLGIVLSSHSELGLVAWRICLGLSQDVAVAQKELVDFTDIEQAQVSRALRIMEKRGLIGSRRSQDDGRIRLLFLTDKGRAHFRDAQPAVYQYYNAIDEALDTAEQEQFLDMARRIALASRRAQRDSTEKFNMGHIQKMPA